MIKQLSALLLIGTLVTEGCTRPPPTLAAHNPATAVRLRTILAPPEQRFVAQVSRDSAIFVLPVPIRQEWSWDVIPWDKRPGSEYLFEVQWDTANGSAQQMGHYVEALSLTRDAPPQRAHRGPLSTLARSLTPRILPRGTAPSAAARSWGSELTFSVMPDELGIVFRLGASERLARLWRTHPDTAHFTAMLSPLGVVYRRAVRIQYH
mgnify:CR=1 FL=1